MADHFKSPSMDPEGARVSSPSSYLRRVLAWSAVGAVVFLIGIVFWQVHTGKVYTFVYKVEPGGQSAKEIAGILSRRIKNLGRYERVRRATAAAENGAVSLSVISSFDVKEYVRYLVRPGVFELRLVHPDPNYLDKDPSAPPPSGYKVAKMREIRYLLGKPGETEEVEVPYLVKIAPERVITRFKSVTFHTEGLERRAVITLQFEPADAEAFQRITASNVGRQLAFFIDEELCSAPKITAPIEGDQAQVQGLLHLPTAKRWAALLDAGAITSRLELVREDVR